MTEPVAAFVKEIPTPVQPATIPKPTIQAPPIIREPLVALGQEQIIEPLIEDPAPQFGQRARIDAPTPESMLQASG
ncbi:MAG: hypothetical protein JKY32_12495 [Rhizobiales bacterium]|nr:hypothetical protein [Hyphomicrobiales bacterium]